MLLTKQESDKQYAYLKESIEKDLLANRITLKQYNDSMSYFTKD
jgi:hypothetical protein